MKRSLQINIGFGITLLLLLMNTVISYRKLIENQRLVAQNYQVIAELEQTIQLQRTQGLNAALQIVQFDQEKQITDGIRQQIRTIEDQENQQRKTESQRNSNETLLTFTLVTGVSLLLLTVITIAFRRIEAQHQRSQLNLKESEERFRAMFNLAAVGIAQVAPNGTWLLVNQKLCEIVGYSREEFLQRTFQDITHPDDLEKDLAYVQQLLANQIQSYSMEKRYIRRDASIVWINLTVVLVRKPNGQPKYFISVIEDISDRKKAESELQHLNATLEQRIAERTTQLTEINQELEAFTYTVSHDLRAPLRIMQGFSQALEEDYGDRLDELAKTYIQSISESAIQMDVLINDLLSYSRLSRTEIRLQSVDLQTAIAAALQQLSVTIQARNAIIHIPANLPSVIAHGSILVQILVNLISNAIKFVETDIQPIVTIAVQTEKNSVRLSVIDNGIGIASKYHDRIFRVFERLHGIETFPGTGIGLAIVRKGIDRLNGQVGLESQLGQGSRFWITLPLASEKNQTLLLDNADLTHDSAPHSLS